MAWVALLAGLISALAVRRREQVVVGEVLFRAAPARNLRARLASLAVIGAVGVRALVSGAELPLPLGLITLSLVASLVVLCPSAGEGVVGRLGLRRGWAVYGLDDLQEWRLSGEHFRFRVDDRWRAIALPPSEHAALEAELQRRLADRQSPYR